MTFLVHIDIMPHQELLDPQGKTVEHNLKHLDVSGVQDVRIGKHVQMHVEATNEAEATQTVETLCEKLLANVIVETYTYTITAVETA